MNITVLFLKALIDFAIRPIKQSNGADAFV